MASDTCGAKSGALTCDRAPHADGDHRGYDEERDAVLFWPTHSTRLRLLEEQIAALLDELDPPARSAATVRLGIAMCKPPTRRARS